MPRPSDSPSPAESHQAVESPPVSAAHFLRGASGFGAVAFREYPGFPAAAHSMRAGHADCLSFQAGPQRWAWADPAGVPREECGS